MVHNRTHTQLSHNTHLFPVIEVFVEPIRVGPHRARVTPAPQVLIVEVGVFHVPLTAVGVVVVAVVLGLRLVSVVIAIVVIAIVVVRVVVVVVVVGVGESDVVVFGVPIVLHKVAVHCTLQRKNERERKRGGKVKEEHVSEANQTKGLTFYHPH